MNRQNYRFTQNVAHYLQSHSIIVPTSFSEMTSPYYLDNGAIYSFDLQALGMPGRVNLQGNATGVLLTEAGNRGAPIGRRTRQITAMWLAGPPQNGGTHAALPGPGTDYVFTVGLGGCSVYIQGANIHHNYSGTVPPGTPPNQGVPHPYPGTNGNHDQTCAVAYRVGGVWNIGTSVPHDSGPFDRTHGASNYHFSGY